MLRLSRVSLLWRIFLSTSIAVTILFAVTGWIVQDQFVRIASQTLEEEIRGSFRAYESLWRARASQLASVSLVLSRMPDVRAAFGTGDSATIRDTAGEIWSKISQEGAIFLVSDPRGAVLASLGGAPVSGGRDLEIVRMAVGSFPNQASGFFFADGRLFQTVVTPVYVAATGGSALLNVLVAGFNVNSALASQLKEATGGSDFVFLCQGRVIASTLPSANAAALQPSRAPGGFEQAHVAGVEYSHFTTPLVDVKGTAIGELHILRSFASARGRIDTLRRNIIGVWLLSVLAGLALTYTVARHVLKPVRALDQAATEIGLGNYAARVEVSGGDELGRLAQTFNDMCESISTARAELIRRERISTIGRLSTSIVHDLRNPLAAIYGGAEMLVDEDLPPEHVKRLAANIYRSSRRVQELLKDLSEVTRGRTQSPEPCRLREVVQAASLVLGSQADSHGISLQVAVAEDLELPLERSRMERVFENLITNSIEAMPEGGTVRIAAEREDSSILISVEDTGPGVPESIRSRLFEPFVSSGKKNGIGLGLALSRQTAIDHGGDLWLDPRTSPGARFILRLPA